MLSGHSEFWHKDKCCPSGQIDIKWLLGKILVDYLILFLSGLPWQVARFFLELRTGHFLLPALFVERDIRLKLIKLIGNGNFMCTARRTA